ncbi:hypothetical protein P152DRAFT_395645 [Eremomyces bilateralis CBS 781.70]|uniref:Histone deacetylase complex subunit SAP30 Sin3 binding domain-containing protein n=1 Tax=Eremomyces bilateralis CBS 781.70 TaxID=1392243 RepID=A0A6G1G5T5_9PEZI|nr:uncharacterized protein P152DRAFT_395645 [Eremomyces bilateralis CBS 781.70]KAF1813388.1 hypothetical protein P152DRAFT_395645 [Eremomyces bilateralis CBS 781.70]
MPPSKARIQADDSKHDEPYNPKEKSKASGNATSGRSRKTAANQANGSSLKKVMTPPVKIPLVNGATGEPAESAGIDWTKEELALLHSYRDAYKLSTPSAHPRSLSHIHLNQGIGKYSPTMLRAKPKRAVTKDQLAQAVRKHFRDMPVNENETIAEMLYKVQNSG